MAESVNGSKGSVQQWGLNDEQNSCESEKSSPRIASRPKEYCKEVTCQSTLTVAGAMTVLPPAIAVGGITFVPTMVTVVASPGSPAAPGGIAVPPTYANIMVLAAEAGT